MADHIGANDQAHQVQVVQEREREREAEAVLEMSYPLPPNVSEMQSFAWGTFTWRDIIVSGSALLVMFLLMTPVGAMFGQVAQIIAAILLAAPIIFVAMRHHFTGDLPVEKRLKIAVDNVGKPDLMVWDKTMKDGKYVATSTHDFVPRVKFRSDGFVTLPGDEGGFSVLKVVCDDSNHVKATEQLQLMLGFNDMLNGLLAKEQNVPIQILLKATRQNISRYVEDAEDCLERIRRNDTNRTQLMKAERARDYLAYIDGIADEARFFHDYYVVVTYREDAEDVGNDSLKSGGVAKQRMKDKMNPFAKGDSLAANVEVDIGQDRAEAIAEARASARFGEVGTVDALNKRVDLVKQAIDRSKTTHTSISSEVMSEDEVSKLFFQCYNNDSDRLLDAVVQQSIDEKPVLVSELSRRDFPDLFPHVKDEDKWSQKVMEQAMLY